MGTPVAGVGARYKQKPLPHQGGGYQNICSDSEVCTMQNFAAAQLRELAEMGVSQTWLKVASVIGVSSFLEMWKLLDCQYDQGVECASSIRVTVPRYDRFVRFQRNQVIAELAKSGKVPHEIQEYLKKQMSIDFSIRSIQRIMRRCHEPEKEGGYLHESEYR